MKGQILYVRAAGPGEPESLREQLSLPGLTPASHSWVGFLVGDPVALARVEVDSSAAELVYLAVSERLRRKRIGTVMLRELEAQLRPGVTRLTVRKGTLPDAFLVRAGFAHDESGFTKDLTAGSNG